MKLPDRSGGDPMAATGIDAHAVEGADTVGADSRGWGGRKRVNDKK
ncbi:hypothetical protein [Rhodococcus sp. MS16]|nr:hypothetical protein [Rhodococcus sp. MS16]